MFSAVNSSYGVSEMYWVHLMSYLNKNNQPLSHYACFKKEKKMCPSIRLVCLVKAKALFGKAEQHTIISGFYELCSDSFQNVMSNYNVCLCSHTWVEHVFGPKSQFFF